jgi:hypothetical protein
MGWPVLHYYRLPDGTLIPVDPAAPGAVTAGGGDADVTLQASGQGGGGGGVDLPTVRSQALAMAIVIGG